MAENVVNGRATARFKYQVSPMPGTYSEQSTVAQADFPNDIAIRTELFIDADTNRAPRETTITTRVFLRNQNRPPSAKLTATYSSSELVTLERLGLAGPGEQPALLPLPRRHHGRAGLVAAGHLRVPRQDRGLALLHRRHP